MGGVVHRNYMGVPISITEVYAEIQCYLIRPWLEPEHSIPDHLYTAAVRGLKGECADVLVQNKSLGGIGR